MRKKTVIKKLLQSVTEVYYKVRQVLQSVTVITKWDVTHDASNMYIGYLMGFPSLAFKIVLALSYSPVLNGRPSIRALTFEITNSFKY